MGDASGLRNFASHRVRLLSLRYWTYLGRPERIGSVTRINPSADFCCKTGPGALTFLSTERWVKEKCTFCVFPRYLLLRSHNLSPMSKLPLGTIDSRPAYGIYRAGAGTSHHLVSLS